MANDMNLQINITGQNDTGNSFSTIDAALADLQKLAMDVSKAFEDFAKTTTSSMDAAGQAVRDMTAPLQADQGALDALAQSMDTVDRAAQTMGETANAAGREMQASMDNAVQASRGLETGLAGAQQGLRNTGDAAVGAGSSIDQLGQAISAEMIGEQLKQIGETGLKVFEEASHAAADFEYNISRIGAVLTTSGKATNDQMQQMSADALKIGSNSTFSANEVAAGMYDLARQGLDATTILGNGVNGAINIVNDLAQATDSSMTDTATVITDVVHEYGLSGEQLRNVANTMSGALHNSSESLDDFYQSMKQVGPVASAMHQNAMDMSTALALLAQHGITGSSAGTALKNMLLGLSPRTKAAAADFAKLGISVKNGAANSFFDLNGNLKPLPDIINLLNEKFNGLSDAQKQAALSTVFTKYGLAGLNTIVGESRDKFLAFQNELKKDDAATIAAKKMDNLHGDLLKFNAGVQTMMKSFGDSINGMLRPIVQGASEAIKWITQLPKPVKEVGMAFLGIGSALAVAGGSVIAFAGGVKMLGPTLEMAGVSTAGLEAAAGTLGAIFSEILIPIAAVVAIVAAVALGFKLAYDHIKPFHDAVNSMIATFKTFGTTVATAVKGIFMIISGTGGGQGVDILQKLGFSNQTIGNLEKLGGIIQAVFTGIKNFITQILTSVGSFVQSFVTKLLTFWNTNQYGFRTTVQNIWSEIGNFIKQAIEFVVNNIVPAVQAIYDFWNQIWPEIAQILKTQWTVISDAVKIALALIQYNISGVLGFIEGFWKNGWQAVYYAVKTAWDLIKGAIQVAWQLISGIIKTGLDLATGNWRQAWNDFLSIFTGIWNVIKSNFSNLVSDAFNFGKNFVLAIGKGIAGAVGSVISAAKNVVSTITGIFSSAPSAPSVGGATVAKHAAGGIFNTPHLGLVAEAGPEAIIPLSDPARGLAIWQQAGEMLGGFTNISPMSSSASSSSSGGGPVYNVNVYASGNVTRNEQQLGDIVSKALLSKVKMQGKI